MSYDAGERWYQRLTSADGYEIWLLSWLPGQGTGFHDHGRSAGAFCVALGALREQVAANGIPDVRARTLRRGQARSFGPRYVHDVRNVSPLPAVSVHAYSPPLASMSCYELTQDGLVRASAPERRW